MEILEKLKSGDLIGITQIKIAAGLEIFPQELYSLVDTLEVLDLDFKNSSPHCFNVN